MKILITAAGGGHFAPALALIERLPKDTELFFIGRKYSLEGDNALSFEYQTASRLNIPFITLTSGRVQRVFTKHTLKSLFKIPLGVVQAYKEVKKIKPDIVVSFGGYVSVPVIIAAKMQKIPIILHEQTLEAGLSNILGAKFANIVCVSWESSKQHFKNKNVVVTGNPVRSSISIHKKNILSLYNISEEEIPLLVITGGSIGSHAINLLVQHTLSDLTKKYRVFHQTGDSKQFNDFTTLTALSETFPSEQQKRYRLIKFIPPEDIGSLFAVADLVIGRAGMSTVTELISLQKPALFIPLAFAQKNEQYKNASMVKQAGLAEILERKNATSETFLTTIESMVENISSYKISGSLQNQPPQDAAGKIINVIYSLV